jgi:hypothetical protein
VKRSLRVALVYGFLLWLIPFAAAMTLFSIRNSDRIFFETIMPVVITITVVVLSYLYFKNTSGAYLKEGIVIGILWLAMSIIFDLAMFTWGPMAMSLIDYLKDIGITYLVYPTVTIGIGYLMETKQSPQT